MTAIDFLVPITVVRDFHLLSSCIEFPLLL